MGHEIAEKKAALLLLLLAQTQLNQPKCKWRGKKSEAKKVKGQIETVDETDTSERGTEDEEEEGEKKANKNSNKQ